MNKFAAILLFVLAACSTNLNTEQTAHKNLVSKNAVLDSECEPQFDRWEKNPLDDGARRAYERCADAFRAEVSIARAEYMRACLKCGVKERCEFNADRVQDMDKARSVGKAKWGCE